MNFPVLDIFIGLVLIYFLYSLLLSIITEMISNWMGMRARHLREGITKMLNDIDDDDDKSSNKEVDNRGIIKTWLLSEPTNFKSSLADKFYSHPNIKYMSRHQSWSKTQLFNKSKPAYLSSSLFVDTVMALLRENSNGKDMDMVKSAVVSKSLNMQPETRRKFDSIINEAGDDIEDFKKKLEEWFDQMMDRVNGWYKRQINTILFYIGLLIVAIFNVDSIEIVKRLSTDDAARDRLVALANIKVDNGSDQDKAISEAMDLAKQDIKNTNQILSLTDSDRSWFSLVGYMLTALALSLGATYWFDLLKKNDAHKVLRPQA